jgi:hypothetical protein
MIIQTNSQPPLAAKVPISITSKLRHDPDLFIDIRDFMPVVVSSADKNNILIHSSFSLANLKQDADEKLLALVNFIRTSQTASVHGLYVGCTHAVAEQIAYLAYWKDYLLEFRIAGCNSKIVVMAHFPRQSQFDCILAVFHDRKDLHYGVHKWFECLYQLVWEHAKIWQIHLIVDRPIYRKLEEPHFIKSDILVEVVDEE